ncbi:MAG: hypothetical protein OHK0046_32170 [Anaerolineae bacterium]
MTPAPMTLILRLADSEFQYVRVIYTPEALILAYGRVLKGAFIPEMEESLLFRDYPELAGLCDGVSWNLTELYCLFDWHGHHITLKERLRRLIQQQRRNNRTPLHNADTRRVYIYLVEYFSQKGWAPSLVEIGEGCYMGKATVSKHLSMLEAWGYLRRDDSKSRALQLIEPIAE